jgi:hypothetical protein
MKTPYTLSTDYAELFDLIQDETAIAGICEYKENHDSPALIFKKEGYWIDSKNPVSFHENSSKAHFEMMCEHYKVRWIKP